MTISDKPGTLPYVPRTSGSPTPIEWKAIHLFISSAFNDMHADRDYLVKSVLPELGEWCERRRLRLIDVDPRWEVT